MWWLFHWPSWWNTSCDIALLLVLVVGVGFVLGMWHVIENFDGRKPPSLLGRAEDYWLNRKWGQRR
jgi:hypothetical protein